MVSIIIRCFNEASHIGRLLSGISQQTLDDVDVIVVDSGSTDATLSIASKYPIRIEQIKKEDFSFGYSLNVGCKAARGDMLVIASAHTYPVYHDWLDCLVSHFDKEDVGLVYGKQRGGEVTRFSEHQVFSKWFPENTNLNQSNPFCNNANAAIRRSLWEKYPYDESLTGLEDMAWAKKIMSVGYRVVYDAAAEVVHVHNETYKDLYNRYRREAIAMKAIFPHEKFSFLDFIKMFAGNFIRDCRAANQQGVLVNNISSILSFRMAQFLGTWRGFRHHGAVPKELKEKFYYPNREVAINFEKDNERNSIAIDYGEKKIRGTNN